MKVKKYGFMEKLRIIVQHPEALRFFNEFELRYDLYLFNKVSLLLVKLIKVTPNITLNKQVWRY